MRVIFYLWLFRGTPVLLQLVFAFNVLPAFGIVLPGFACAVLALGLNEGAYMAEIMRSGIRAVGPGQRLAARALGLEDSQVMRWVVLPQALRIVIPPIGNQFIGMLKLSALVSVIGVQELLLVSRPDRIRQFPLHRDADRRRHLLPGDDHGVHGDPVCRSSARSAPSARAAARDQVCRPAAMQIIR